MNDRMPYIVGELRSRLGSVDYRRDGNYHHWTIGNWRHTTRGSYEGLTFQRLIEEIEQLVNSYKRRHP